MKLPDSTSDVWQCNYSSSGSTTRQISFSQCEHLPRRTRLWPFSSAVSRTILTEPRHLPQKTLSRIFCCAHSGIFSHRSLACGVNLPLDRLDSFIFLFQFSFLSFLLYMLQQSAGVYYLQGKISQRLKADILACRLVFYQPIFIINLKLVSVFYLFRRLR